jgi:serine/threonine-protein kinase
MSFCPDCGARAPDGARFCAACGSRLSETGTDGATVAAPRSGRSSTPLPGAGRHAPGTLIQDRYRIVGPLGRGGMGEVYRADDLTLGQPVALKFLPDAFAANADLRSRFYGEVRVARQVAHPNLCRVYDIGDFDGRVFLSMEFVDGEDLSSLLRRIGRLPQEKAVDIARQLCAGLGALHDRGVLHRDLKPANVMVDGRGRVRITDFGLSIPVEEMGADVRVGTPAYMSPEQLSGEGADVRSDLYSLGVTLYEVFTGKRAFEADTLAEITRLHREATPASPSEILPDLDPLVERVIVRCLEKNPASRPPSAIAVAAALPGGDPLAAALAAGEIPSLEMVAAAGERGGVRPIVGIACVAAVVVALVLYAKVNADGKITRYDPMEKPPAVLADRAREILHELGQDAPARDSAHGFAADGELLQWIEREDASVERWERLRDARPAGVQFWYRQAPVKLLPMSPSSMVEFDDPPPLFPGMASAVLDTRGRLVGLHVVPPDRVEGAAAQPVDWSAMLRAAGLDPDALEPVEPEWVPPSHADERAAWLGTFPGETGTPMRFEAAALRGRPVHFRTIGPWTEPRDAEEEERGPVEIWGERFLLFAITFVLFGAVFLAIRNVRMGRGDVKSARRLSLAVFLVIGVRWALVFPHTDDFGNELNEFLLSIALQLLVAAAVWCFYLALEPYVRKWWPDQLVAWSRILTGRWRDPLVGRDILVGGVFFLFLTLPDAIEILSVRTSGKPLEAPGAFQAWASFLGVGGMLATTLGCFLDAIFYGMFFLLCVLLLRFILRSQRAALAAFATIIATIHFLGALVDDENRVLAASVGLASGVGYAFVLLRFGMLPVIFGSFLRLLTTRFPVTLDGSAWYASSSVFAVVAVLGLTGYGLAIALSGRSLRDWLLDEPGA